VGAVFLYKKFPKVNNIGKRGIFMDNKKENQVDNLMNLVEKHTRTERHLEQ